MHTSNRAILLLGLSLSLAGCGLSPASFLSLGSQSPALAQDLSESDSPTLSFQVPSQPTVAPDPWQDNNSATLHIGPADNVAAIENVIKSAKQTLFIETFSFANDSFGQAITPLLIDAVKRGVKVYVLCDYIGSRFLGGKTLGEQLTAAGAHFRMWDPRFVKQNDQNEGINIDHRKLYLADGYRGLTGGVNIHAPFAETTHDLLVDFRGDEAEQLHAEFARNWANAGGSPISWAPLPVGVHFGNVEAKTIVTSPVEGRFEAQAVIYQALDSAQHTIIVEQQYLWDQGVMDRLLAACKRGVTVRAIIPGKSDKYFKYLHADTMNQLLSAGAQVHLYNGIPDTAHCHTKYFSVDGKWAAFGSVNADTRGMMDNQELDVETTDPGLVRELQTRLFDADWQNSSVIDHFDPSVWYDGPFNSLWQVIAYYC